MKPLCQIDQKTQDEFQKNLATFCADAKKFQEQPRGELELDTSRGKIVVLDTHIFEIIVPENEQLVLTFRGTGLSFRVGGFPETARNTPHTGRNFQVEKPSS